MRPSHELSAASSFAQPTLEEQPELAETEEDSARRDELAAWLTVCGAWLTQFSTFGYLNAFGVYQDYYTRTFLPDESPSNISWIGSVQLFLMYAPAAFVGRAFDAGYFYHTQIAGTLLQTFSILMLSLARPGQYWQVFLAQGLGTGLASGLLFLPSLSITAQHFRTPAARARATGLVVSGASIGGVVWPIALNRMFAAGIGWRDGVRVAGAIVGALLILACAVSRTRPTPARTGHAAGAGWRAVAADGAYTWSVAGAFCANLGLFVPYFYLQLFTGDRGLAPALQTYSLAILNAGSTLGRVLPVLVPLCGRLAQHAKGEASTSTLVAPPPPPAPNAKESAPAAQSPPHATYLYGSLAGALLACAALLFALFAPTTAGVSVTAALFGVASGVYVSLIPPLLGMLCPDARELGLRMGIAFSVVGLAMLVGNPIFGALLRTAGDAAERTWWRAIVFAGVCVLAGLALMLVSWRVFVVRGRRRRADASYYS